MALGALLLHDRLACPFRQIRRLPLVIQFVAGDAPGAPNPSIRHLRLRIRQRHVGRRRLAGRQSHRRGLALEAVPNALHRVIPRGQVVHCVTALRLTDEHERQTSLCIDQFDIGSGKRLPGCTLDHTLNAAGKVCRSNRVNTDKQHSSRDYSWDATPMAKHRFSPPLAGIESSASRPLKSVHPFACNRSLQKRFSPRCGNREKRDGEKTGFFRLPSGIAQTQRWPRTAANTDCEDRVFHERSQRDRDVEVKTRRCLRYRRIRPARLVRSPRGTTRRWPWRSLSDASISPSCLSALNVALRAWSRCTTRRCRATNRSSITASLARAASALLRKPCGSFGSIMVKAPSWRDISTIRVCRPEPPPSAPRTAPGVGRYVNSNASSVAQFRPRSMQPPCRNDLLPANRRRRRPGRSPHCLQRRWRGLYGPAAHRPQPGSRVDCVTRLPKSKPTISVAAPTARSGAGCPLGSLLVLRQIPPGLDHRTFGAVRFLLGVLELDLLIGQAQRVADRGRIAVAAERNVADGDVLHRDLEKLERLAVVAGLLAAMKNGFFEVVAAVELIEQYDRGLVEVFLALHVAVHHLAAAATRPDMVHRGIGPSPTPRVDMDRFLELVILRFALQVGTFDFQ